MSYFAHERAIVESDRIGEGTRIWANAHILPGAVLGANCNVCDGVFIENDVLIGDDVTIKCGVQLWDGVRLGNSVFIGPNATFTNDMHPRSRRYPEEFLRTIVEDGASIGANATILPGITIGRGALVGAGAVVTRSVPPHAIVVGNPARIIGYENEFEQQTLPDSVKGKKSRADNAPEALPGAQLIWLPNYEDIRGSLSVGSFSEDLPFEPQRYFLVYDVPSQETRGEHAHRTCHQFLICVSGSVKVMVDNGITRQECILDKPNMGLHIHPMTWGTQYRYTDDAVLLVFASEPYDSAEYIRDYDEFLKAVAAKQAQ